GGPTETLHRFRGRPGHAAAMRTRSGSTDFVLSSRILGRSDYPTPAVVSERPQFLECGGTSRRTPHKVAPPAALSLQAEHCYLIACSSGLRPFSKVPKPNGSGLYSPTRSTLDRVGIRSSMPAAQ